MTICWIIREVRMISGIICGACFLFCIPFSSAKSRGDSSSRPVVISLPMRVGVGVGPSSSFYEDSTEFEPRGEQRLVPRVFDPYSDSDYAQDDNGDQDNNANFQGPNFLQWNPNNRFMVLQISDFIGSRPAEDDPPPPNDSQEDDEDEHEEAEDTTRVKKKRRRPSQQGTFDFEDFRRLPEPRRNRQKKTKTSSSEWKSRKRDEEDQQEDEGDERDVYGTDPVVHYLKERRGNKDRKRDFGFGGMRDDDDGDEFTMKEWWNY